MYDIKKDFDRDGYILIPNFITTNEVEVLRQICDTASIGVRVSDKEWWTEHIPDNDFITNIFRKYDLIADELFGGTEKYDKKRAPNFKVTCPGGGKIAPHFDAPYDRARWHNDFDFVKCIQICIIIDKFDESTGGTMIWPGSHFISFNYNDVLFGKLNEDFLQNGVIIKAEPGTLLCFHARVMHSTMPNYSLEKRRLLLSLNFSNNKKFKKELNEKDNEEN